MAQLLSKSVDQRIVYSDRTWAQFKLIQQGFENALALYRLRNGEYERIIAVSYQDWRI